MRQFPQQFIYPPTVPPRGADKPVFAVDPLVLPSFPDPTDRAEFPADITIMSTSSATMAFAEDGELTVQYRDGDLNTQTPKIPGGWHTAEPTKNETDGKYQWRYFLLDEISSGTKFE